ncbi:hypothetical protein FRC96_03480 [Lujinxingia vulgaris]|uniref:Uncharacterized protein n=1 Tax=Lujinxingia vulgaris TaxID=2600176 RepID=A0A5C6XI44_9DELT|nr:hypothetical protein [Lujinxingia vulgaris]TXD41770.1 hypothetical protein FRC96_03480 [Lujinxingia vulgaris]
MSAQLLEPAAEIPGFRVGHCPQCQRAVLAARDLEGDELVEVCMHCSCNLTSGAPQTLRWVEAADLVELGYFVDGFEPEDCDSHGGCRDGACGVRQPA